MIQIPKHRIEQHWPMWAGKAPPWAFPVLRLSIFILALHCPVWIRFVLLATVLVPIMLLVVVVYCLAAVVLLIAFCVWSVFSAIFDRICQLALYPGRLRKRLNPFDGIGRGVQKRER
jgi:hypothetical protein